MSGKKTTQNSTQTMTPNNPQWVTDTIQGLSGNINSLAGQDPKSFFAGPTGLMQGQFDLAGALSPTVSGWLNDAGNLARWADDGYQAAQMQAAQVGPASHATASTAAQNMGSYFNPFTEQVVNSTLDALDRGRQLAQNTNGQSAILAGGYGGSRQGVVDANLNRDFAKQAADAAGQLNLQGFNTAAQLGAGDADRQTGVSTFNAGQDNTLAALQAQLQQQANQSNQGATNQASQFNLQNMLNSAGLLGQLGGMGLDLLGNSAQAQQGIAQQQAQAPLSVLQALTGAAGSLPYGLFQGQTTTGNSTTKSSGSVLDTIGKVAQIGANIAAISDIRAKRDVETVGYDAKGRRWVDFRYHWDADDAPKHRGVMAQEVMRTDPGAVGLHPNGFLMVDYSKLED